MPDNKDEMSLKDLINILEGTIRFLLSKWLLLLAIGLIGGILGIFYALNKKPIYTAELSFVLSSESKSSGSLVGLASQFGVDLGNSSNDLFSGDNITSLMVSKRILQKVLFKKPSGSRSPLINIITKELGLDKAWEKNEYLKKALPFPVDAAQLTPIQDSLLREICFIIPKKMLTVSKPEKKQSIFVVDVTSTSELFSLYTAKYLVEETAQFYISTKTKVAKQNLDIIQHEADSLRQLLSGSIIATAEQVDATFNLNPAFQVKRSGAQQGQSRVSILTAAYSEVVKNVEIARLALQKETPLFQIIDEPTLPLKKNRKSKLVTAIAGAFIFTFLTAVLLLLRRFYVNIKNE